MRLLSSTINDPPRPQPFLLFLSSLAQSAIPVVRQILTNGIKTRSSNSFLVFAFIYPPADLLDFQDVSFLPTNTKVYDLLDAVPGYDNDWTDPRKKILSAVESAPPGSIQVTIDSVDVLCSDIGSIPETYKFLSDLLGLVRARPSIRSILPISVQRVLIDEPVPSRLILHATRPSPLLPLLVQPTFSSSLGQLTAHPAALLTHLAKDYLTPPPPSSPQAKFWSVFLPLSERSHDVERIVYGYGSSAEGSGRATEIVCEIIVRGGDGRKRGIERELEGWSIKEGFCSLTKLESLKGVWTKMAIIESAPDPTQNVSFNLNLTSSQQESRAQVPLPYAHEGNSTGASQNATAAIFYDPDSADDIDDDDPDEDLDI